MEEEFAEMSTADLEEMKRQLQAEIDEIKDFNEGQAQKQAEVEKEKARLLEDIEKREKEEAAMDGRLGEILKELQEKESQIREVFDSIEVEAQATEKQERQNQVLREAFTEVENFTILMDTFQGKLDGKVAQIKDQMANGGQLA